MAYYELHKASHDRIITAKYWIKSKTLSLDDCAEVQHCMWQIIGYTALERKIHPTSQLGIVFNEHRWDWALERSSVTFSKQKTILKTKNGFWDLSTQWLISPISEYLKLQLACFFHISKTVAFDFYKPD